MTEHKCQQAEDGYEKLMRLVNRVATEGTGLDAEEANFLVQYMAFQHRALIMASVMNEKGLGGDYRFHYETACDAAMHNAEYIDLLEETAPEYWDLTIPPCKITRRAVIDRLKMAQTCQRHHEKDQNAVAEEHVPGISPILDMIRKVLLGKDIHIVKMEPKK